MSWQELYETVLMNCVFAVVLVDERYLTNVFYAVRHAYREFPKFRQDAELLLDLMASENHMKFSTIVYGSTMDEEMFDRLLVRLNDFGVLCPITEKTDVILRAA